MYQARYVPRVLEGRALSAVVCHGALRVVRAVRLKSPGPGVRVRRVGALQLEDRDNCKCSQAICTVVSATCNSHVLLHRQCPIVDVVHEVAAETVSRRRRYRTWQGAVTVNVVGRPFLLESILIDQATLNGTRPVTPAGAEPAVTPSGC